MEERDIATRCYTIPLEKKSGGPYIPDKSHPTFDRYLCFDTETTTDPRESLKFGSAKLVIQGSVAYTWLFYDERNIADKEIAILESFENCILLKVRDFVERVFLPEIYDNKTPLVGFNLPFDLSRMAIRVGYARKSSRGGFSFTLSPNYPHLLIRHINSHYSQIKFMKGRPDKKNYFGYDLGSNDFPGHFVDLRTLSFALTNQSYSLNRACKRFGVPYGKLEVEQHGKVTPEYVKYNINDVEITHLLFQQLLAEVQRYSLDVDITRLVSPASVGKAYLNAMGVIPFLEKNPEYPPELLGKIMASYFGGRSEVRIRLEPRSIRLLDFLSMYPTMCGILGIWKLIISERIDYVDVTDEVKQLIQDIELDDLRDKEVWKKFNVICEVVPNEDVFIVRSDFNSVNYNLATAYLTADKALTYTLADVISSKLLTGKNPNILKAIRFVPIGIQDELCNLKMVGDHVIDPKKDDFFIALATYRQFCKEQIKAAVRKGDTDEAERYDSIQNAVKIILNSTSYGIFVQENVHSEEGDVRVFSSSDPFESRQSVIEKPGPFFNPIIGTMVTSAARLVLAITESLLLRRGAVYAFCDTDSMAVPPENVEEIQSFFQGLNPYPFRAELFKVEKYNFDEQGNLVDLKFLGISAKRYVLYYEKNGRFIIQKASYHGLGHIKNPFKNVDDNQWIDEIWMDFLLKYHQKISEEELNLKYSDSYAISPFTVTTPRLLQRLNVLNTGSDYNDQIKPFNFCIVGVANKRKDRSDQVVKPLAPFTKYPQEAVHRPFVDYTTGKVLQGPEYWKPIEDVLFRYITHPESKFKGEMGELSRRHIRVKSVFCIGKESNNLERSRYFGISNDDLITYGENASDNTEKQVETFLMSLSHKNAKRFQIEPRMLARWRKAIRQGKHPKFQARSKERILRAMNTRAV